MSSGRPLGDLRQVVRKTPEDHRAWFELGKAAIDAGKIGEACFALTHAVQLPPFEIAQALGAATLLAEAGCHPEAEDILRFALEREPERKDVTVQLAQLLMNTGRERQAASELAIALQSDPKDVGLRLLAAAAHERVGALAEAAGHLVAALAVDATDLVVNTRLATVLAKQQDHTGAARCWRLVVMRTRGRDLEALTALGISLSVAGQHDEALQILKEVARRQGQAAPASVNLGGALAAAGQLTEARAVFERAVGADPDSAQAHTGLGLVLQRMGDRDGARRALQRATSLAPDAPEPQAALRELSSRGRRSLTPTPALLPHSGGAAITGDLKSFQLFDVLEFLRLQRKTGSLVVSSRRGAGVVRLVDGAVTSASAPQVKRLGQALLDSQLITQPQLDTALARQREEPRTGVQALGSVLLEEKLIDRDRLTVAIRRQLLAALEDMLNWPEGAFSFHPAGASGGPPVSFDLQDVMLKLISMTDERKAGLPPRPD